MTLHAHDDTTQADASQGPTSSSTTGNVLRILSGVHAGASRELAAQEMILVGCGDDCDIVLADVGVVRHHALINLAGGSASLRALDAPLRLDGQPVLPGDPVVLGPLQQIRLGNASIAYGPGNPEAWGELLPDAAAGGVAVRAQRPSSRRLPIIAALAVLSLAAVALLAAFVPMHVLQPDPNAQLEQLRSEFNIEHGQIKTGADGVPVLSGMVMDEATIARIRQRLQDEDLQVGLDLRSGQKIAEDVKEVARTMPSPLNVQSARYLGNGTVEISGRFEDADALKAAVQSRAMNDVQGVKVVQVRNSAPNPTTAEGDATATAKPAQPETVRIVSIVRGKDAHVVALDGTPYLVGADLPGLGRLVSIGEIAQVMSSDGMLHKIKLVTAAELAAEKAAAEMGAAQSQQQTQAQAQTQTGTPGLTPSQTPNQASAPPAAAQATPAVGGPAEVVAQARLASQEKQM